MSAWSRIWQRIRGTPDDAQPAEQAPAPASTREPAPPSERTALTRKRREEIALLAAAGTAEGPPAEHAARSLALLRASPDEGITLHELARLGDERGGLAEPVALALAAALVDRGDLDVAERVLAHATSANALLLRADLAERRGDAEASLALVERVMLRDVDHPGARERHLRLREALGGAAPRPAPSAGATVVSKEPDAPYDLLREVGRGGAGAVYEARDRELGRLVALKVYHHPARDRAQLELEARVSAAIGGPHVVRVLDIDPDHGWVALAWARGGTLKARLGDAAAAIDAWALPLAEALARTHAAGWVHNDVKPANVLLDDEGSAILTDFGIARRIGEPAPPGSMGYVSPERLAGRGSDPRDDVYGFGRVLEDAFEHAADAAVAARYRPLASACLGKDDARPADGRALVTRLRVERAEARR